MKKDLNKVFDLLYGILDATCIFLLKEIFLGNLLHSIIKIKSWFIRRKVIKAIKTVFTKNIECLGIFNKLTTDARLFLLVNLYYLLITPIYFEMFRNGQPSSFFFTKIHDKYIKSLEIDLRLILRRAQNLSGGNTISGHLVIKSVDELWSSLKLAPLKK